MIEKAKEKPKEVAISEADKIATRLFIQQRQLVQQQLNLWVDELGKRYNIGSDGYDFDLNSLMFKQKQRVEEKKDA